MKQVNSQSDEEKIALEKTKVEIDIAKHFSTLSAGSVVLIATLLDKLPKPIVATDDLRVALIALLVSLALSMFNLWTPWETLASKPKPMVISVNKLSQVLAGMAFLVGVMGIGFFAISNVQHLGQSSK